MALVPNLPCPLGAEAGSHLARFVAAERAAHPERYRNLTEPCGTCAFRAGTLPNQCLATVADALKCVMEGDRFLCHESPVDADGEHTGVCMGWAVLRGATPKRDEPLKMPWDYSDEGESLATHGGPEPAEEMTR
jgi:hypothetical protein